MSQEGPKSNQGGKGRILQWYFDVPAPEIPAVNYASLILDDFPQYGDQIATVDAVSEKSHTYNALHSRVLKLSAALTASGIGLGDAVLLLSRNHIDFPVVLLAVMHSGATCVPVNPSLTKDELTHVVRVSKAKWVITNNKITSKVEEAYAPLGSDALKQIWIIDDDSKGKPSLDDLIKLGHPESAKRNIEGFDSAKTVAMMPFSSGTTGLPKGVMLSHRNLLTAYFQTKYLLSLLPDMPINIFQSTFVFIPLYHIYGFNITISTITTGGKLVLRSRFSPEEYFQTIEKYQVTYSPIVPQIAKFLLDTPLVEKYDLSSLILFLSGSSPISESTLESLTEKTEKISMQAYGMTETCATVGANGGVAGSRPDSVGRVAPYFEAKVIDLETGELLSEGEEGELCVRGPGVTLGYANNPKATAETIDSEGWLHTGDLFYYDEDNFLFITDRIKDLIKVKGYQVSPTEIENVLQTLDEVSDVAVAGVPHDRLGEAPRAWVVPAEGATIDPKKLMKHVADNLVSYKQLTGGIELVESLPKNHLGKILRRQLRNSYTATRSKL